MEAGGNEARDERKLSFARSTQEEEEEEKKSRKTEKKKTQLSYKEKRTVKTRYCAPAY